MQEVAERGGRAEAADRGAVALGNDVDAPLTASRLTVIVRFKVIR
jgi:hypothetical protein